MSKSRSGPRPSSKTTPDLAPPPAAGPLRAWVRFWFAPADPVALHRLRLFAGLVFLAWLLPLAGHADDLFGLGGWFDRQAYREAAHIAGGPPLPLSWSLLYLCGSRPALVTAFYWLAIGALALFTFGVATRLTAVLTWLVVASFTASPALVGDADGLLLVLAFYLMLGYLLLSLRDPSQPLAARLLGPPGTFLLGRAPATLPARGSGSVAANLALRLLQVHLAILMVAAGLRKLQSGDWWAGLALWYPLHPPLTLAPGQVGSPAHVAELLPWLSVAGYAVLAWQLGFPTFAWRPRCRPLLLGGALVGWLGCALLYRVPTLGPALFVGCLGYLTANEWRRLDALFGKLPGLRRFSPRLLAAAEPFAPQGARREDTEPSLA